MLTKKEETIKRVFDFFLSFTLLLLLWWVILLAYFAASFSTKSNGVFIQKRVGRGGKVFSIYKLKTMVDTKKSDTTVTTSSNKRITKIGKFLRKTKLDELPQLINILKGEMSFVGPRPDVPGFADMLKGEDRIVLTVRPGITGPASIKYKDEEQVLSGVKNPEEYNKEIIYPDKVKINKEYIKNYSFKKDLIYIIKTVTG